MQGMWYTTPGLSCWGTWSLGCTRSCRKVLIGRRVHVSTVCLLSIILPDKIMQRKNHHINSTVVARIH